MLEALRLGLQGFLESMGFGVITGGQIIMLLVSFVLLYLAIVKGFEPLLLLPIAFECYWQICPSRTYGRTHWHLWGTGFSPGAIILSISRG